jgi:hypothetical protein
MYFIDANRMTRAPHPSYSLGLGPSDFFLLEDAKRQLSGGSFDHADDLLTAVQEILDGFDKPPLMRVLRNG